MKKGGDETMHKMRVCGDVRVVERPADAMGMLECYLCRVEVVAAARDADGSGT